jgi:hypothetical protein
MDRVKEEFRRNDILALLVAMLGSPPLPTKLFVKTGRRKRDGFEHEARPAGRFGSV